MSNEEKSPLAPNPKLLREALAQYRAWNEAEFVEQVRNAGKKTPAEKWQEYQEAFARLPKPSPEEQRRKMEEIKAYYASMRRFEAERAKRQKQTRT